MENLNTELRLENRNRDNHFLTVFADIIKNDKKEKETLIGLNIIFNNEMVDLCGDTIVDAEYFHLDKFQVEVLIDYLKRVRKSMK
jgi:hypothetical protein